MHVNYPAFGISVDLDDLEKSKSIFKLKDIYKDIPDTKCNHCPLKKGVEADCCKTFSPPMNLVEFLNILKHNTYSKEQKIDLICECIKSYLNPNYIKPCLLLKNNQCSVYEQRPFSCRMFGLYTQDEWNSRLESISVQLDVEKQEVPFFCQCKGIEVTGKKSKISKKESDESFKKIHELDLDFFNDLFQGRQMVYSSITYMPFDAHFLSIFIPVDEIENLATTKLMHREKIKKFKNKEISKKELDIFENNIKDYTENLCVTIRESFTNE
jgi:Fe-S-cluster containining protein